MQNKKLKSNLFYQTVYQIVTTLSPLIISPYLSRVLGASGLGIFAYKQSIVNYFVLLSLLGISNYGTRVISQQSCNDPKLSKTLFIEVHLSQLLSGSAAIVLYLAYTILFVKEYFILSIIQVLFLISSVIDISWYYYGIEEFKKIVIRNIIVKIATIILIFIFVRTKNDVKAYTIIMSITALLGQLVIYIEQIIKITKVTECVKIDSENVKKHLLGNIKLFVPVIAFSIYTIMDKSMVGWLSTYEQLGFYYNVDKVINIPFGIISGLISVLYPRLSSMSVKTNNQNFEQSYNLVSNFILVLSIGLFGGIVLVSDPFVPIFFGKDFFEVTPLVSIMALVVPIKAMSLVIRNLYMLPNSLDNEYTKAIIVGAIVNLIVNYFMIKKYGALGAIYGTIAAEFVILIIQINFVRRVFKLEHSFNSIKASTLGLICMFILNKILYFENQFFYLLVKILLGSIIYLMVITLYYYLLNKDKLIQYKELLFK